MATQVYVRESKADGSVELLTQDDFSFRVNDNKAFLDAKFKGSVVETNYNRFYFVDSILGCNGWAFK